MNKEMLLILIPLIISAGCVIPTTHSPSSNENSFKITTSVSHSSIISGTNETFYVDFVNNLKKPFKNVVFEIFDAPFFEGSCRKEIKEILPGSTVEISCDMKSEDLDKNVNSQVLSYIEFESSENIYQKIETISKEEYENNRIPQESRQYSYNDGYLEVDVSLPMQPVVFVNGKKYYMNVEVKNIGPGIVEKMDISVDKNGIIGECKPRLGELKNKNEYMFSCEIIPPKTKVLYVGSTIIKIDYKYKILKSMNVEIRGEPE